MIHKLNIVGFCILLIFALIEPVPKVIGLGYAPFFTPEVTNFDFLGLILLFFLGFAWISFIPSKSK